MSPVRRQVVTTIYDKLAAIGNGKVSKETLSKFFAIQFKTFIHKVLTLCRRKRCLIKRRSLS
jgi:hypothetical protein